MVAKAVAMAVAKAFAEALASSMSPTTNSLFLNTHVASLRTGHVPQSLFMYIYVKTFFNYALSLHPRI